MSRLSWLRSHKSGSQRRVRLAELRRSVSLRPWAEGLEDRTVMSTITWNTTTAPTGGDWDTASNWVGGRVPGPSDTAKITGLAGPGIVFLNSSAADSISSLATDSTATVNIITGSLTLGSAGTSSLSGPLTIGLGAAFSVGAGSTIAISSTVTDNGNLNFSDGDVVNNGFGQIIVNGTMTASTTTFNSGSTTVNSGGTITPTNSTFNTTLNVNYASVASLTPNISFNTINIQGGTLPAGATLNLNAIGLNTSKLSYGFTSNFIVALNATLAVGPNVTIATGVTLTNNGTLSFASGDVVNNGFGTITDAGTMTSTGTTFSSGTITINSGATFTPTSSVFNTTLNIPYGNVASLTPNISFSTINVAAGTLPSGATLNLNAIGIDTSKLAYGFTANFIIASGATLAVGPNVSIATGVTLTNNGTLSFATGDVVNNGFGTIIDAGTMTASHTTFTSGTITINSGATFTPTNSVFNTTLNIPYGNVTSLTPNTSFSTINIAAGTLPNGSTLNLNAIGTDTSKLAYGFTGNFVIALGATLAVGANVSIATGVTLTNNGTLSFATGDVVNNGFGTIIDAGTMTSTGTTFTSGTITVNSGATFTPTISVFNTTLNIPYANVPSLSPNISFSTINVAAGTLPAGSTLNLNAIGTDTSKLAYGFTGNFTIALGATVAVGPNVSISTGVTLTDNGTLSFGTGDIVNNGFGTIAVTGTMTSNRTAFTSGSISVTNPGVFTATGSTFTSNLTFATGTNDTIHLGKISGPLNLASGATISISGNDFSSISNNNIVASGDPAASIDISGNYWGTTNTATIAAKIVDHTTNVNLPTIVYQPILSGAGTTQATSTSVTYSSLAQNVALSAVVTSGGSPIDGGTETFTILQGTTQIGNPLTVNVLSGAASGNYPLPAGTVVGTYTIQAVFNGNANYLGFTDASKVLTVNQASVTLSPSSQSTTYSGVATTTIPLNASLTSSAGIVSEGTITYTIFQGATVIGVPVTVNVLSGAAPASYVLPGGTPGGIFVIQAAYVASNFQSVTSTTARLTVNAAITGTATTSTNANFSAAVQSIPLVASVSSAAGIVNEGFETFTILNSTNGTVGTPVTVPVVNGTATASYPLPAGTVGGTYKIVDTFNGTANYQTSTDSTKQLSISSTPTVTTAANASVPLNASGQSVTLTATVTGAGNPVGEGSVAFTILNNGTPIGSTKTGTVTGGTASVSYALPGTLTIGVYTIQAVYTDVGNYLNSSDSTHTLGVIQAPGTQLKIHTQPSTGAIAGQAFGTQPVIYVEDANGNLETADNSTVVTVALATGSGPLQGTLTATAVGGVATFANLGDLTAETITLLFTSGNLASATSNSITISPATGTKLVVTQQPSSTGTAAQVFATQPVVKEEDQFGNVITGDSTHTITAARGGAGTSILRGSALTVTLVNGVATFSGLSYNKAEIMNITFTINTTGVTSATSSNVSISPTTASQLVILQQPSSTATAGQLLPAQPIVAAEDPYGNIETGDNTTQVKAVIGGGVGPLQGTTTVTVVGGVATFTNLADITAETITLKLSSGQLNSATTSSIVITPAAAAQWVIQIQPYANVVAGNPLTDPIVLNEVDQYGNQVTSDNSSVVTASIATGSGVLYGVTSVTAVRGQASFDNLEDDTAGPLTLQFTGAGLPPTLSGLSTVTAAPASGLTIPTRPPGGVIAGVTLTALTVYAHDPFGNIDTTYSGPITIGTAPGSTGTLSGTLTVNAVNGVATFTNVIPTTSGSISLTASSGSLGSAPPTTSVVISPATPSGFLIRTQPSALATAGQPFAIQPVVAEVDQFGNVVTSDSSTVVSVILGSGNGPLQGTTTATLQNGVATFANLSENVAGTITLQFSGGGLSSPKSSSVLVNPAAANRLVFQIAPSSAATAGQSFATQPVLYEVDQYNNVETNDNSSVVNALLSTGAGPLQGTSSVTVKAGVATFTNLSDNKAETIALRFTSGALAAGPSNNIVVSPGAPGKLVISTQPSQTVVAGVPLATQPVVMEEDQFNNLEVGDNTTVLTAFLGSGGGPLDGVLTATVTAGVARFTGIAADTAGTITLQFTGATVTSAQTVPIVVSPGAASKLIVQTQPSATATAGQSFVTQPVVYEVDQFNNVEVADNSSVITAAVASGVGPLHGGASITVHAGIAVFTNLADNKAETITLGFSSGSLTSVTSSAIVVGAAAASKLVIQTQPSSTAAAGHAFAVQPVIRELDQYDNLVTSDNTSNVTVSLASGAGPLQGTTSLTLNGGVAAFTNLADNKAEAIALKFAIGSLATGASSAINVAPAAPAKLVIVTQPSQSALAGVAFATQPAVVEEDQYNNIETSDNSTILTASLSSGTGPLDGSLNATMKSGVATFTGIAADTAGTIALRFTGGGLATGASTPITIHAGAPSRLVIQTQPSASSNAGQPFATQPVVLEEDQFGNLETDDNGTVVTAIPASGVGPLQGASVTVVNGVARFAALADATGEQLALKFVAGNAVSQPSTPINVIPLPPAIISASWTMGQAVNSKGKKTGPKLLVYTITFSAPVDAATLTNGGFYEIDSYQNAKKAISRAAFKVSASTANSVSLMLTKTQKFSFGGQILVRIPGVRNPTLNIAKSGKGITTT